ncbi:MAG: hypothetical protein QM660_07135 [Dysgonomonas sp.]
MMKKYYKYLTFAFITSFLLLGATSCTKEYTTEEYYTQGVFPQTIYYTVRATDWKWNDGQGRYEYYFDEPKITKKIYDDAVIVGSYFADLETQDEKQRMLPDVYTYSEKLDNGSVVIYTETISFDVAPGKVGFYIQASDLKSADKYLADYQFKISTFIE